MKAAEYCRCGARITTHHSRYPDYCKECSVAIMDCLQETLPVRISHYDKKDGNGTDQK